MAEPPEKRQKTGEEEEEQPAEAPEAPEAEAPAEETAMQVDEPKEPEAPAEPEELEQDEEAPKGSIKESTKFLVKDTTMNVMATSAQNVLMPLSDGGFQYLLACARASTGVKAGRYMFEVKVVEFVNPAEDNRRHSGPKQQLRIGFATSSSSLFFGDGEESACFDTSDGNYVIGKKKTGYLKKLAGANLHARESVLAVVLNLAPGHANTNTVSLFKDGVRISQPQALPEGMVGKPLFPMVNFKNLTIHVNFGKEALKSLPFKCRMIQDLPTKEASLTKEDAPEDGKYEVVFPVSLPDEGTFDWLDGFLETSKKSYTELSDRAILDWAVKSGLYRQRPSSSNNDKPEYGFGMSYMDDFSVRRMMQSLAPVQQRNYVVMEVKSNLIPDERKTLLEKFPDHSFKKVAYVACGAPPAAFVKRISGLVLKAKQEKSDQEHRLKLAEAKRKKLLEKQAKEKEKAKKKAEKEEAAKKKAAEKEAKKAAGEEVAEDEPEPAEEAEEEEAADDVDMDEDPPKVELSDEEKKMKFRAVKVPDMMPVVLALHFTKFEMPTAAEGFADIKYEFGDATKAKEYMKNWILDRKITTRVEDLLPGDYVPAKLKEFVGSNKLWNQQLNEYKASLVKKAQEKEAKAQAKLLAAKKAEAAKLADEAKKKAEEELKKKKEAEAGDAEMENAEGEAAAEEKKEDEPEEKKEEEAPVEMEVDDGEDEKAEEEAEKTFKDIDVFGVDDPCDAVKGKPLFKEFQLEDWTLMTLRYEMHLLVHGFRSDVKDPERVGIHVDHLSFYYQKYFKKPLVLKTYGVETNEELLKLIDDTVLVNSKKVVESLLPSELETADVFLKLAEEARRYRNCKIDLGEESFKLKIMTPAQAESPWKLNQSAPAASKGSSKGWDRPSKGYEKGGYDKGYDSKGFSKGGYDKGYDKGGYDKGKGKDWNSGKGDSKGADGKSKGADGKSKNAWGAAPGKSWQSPAPKSEWTKGGGGDKGGYDKGGYDKGGYGKKGDSKGWQSKGWSAPRQVAPPMGKGK